MKTRRPLAPLPHLTLALLALTAPAGATELNLGVRLEGTPLVHSKVGHNGGYLRGAAAQAAWRLGPALDLGFEVGWSANDHLESADYRGSRDRVDLPRVVGQAGWGRQAGDVRLALTLEAGIGFPSTQGASPAATTGLLVGVQWAAAWGLELVGQFGGRFSAWRVDQERDDPVVQLAFPIRLGLQYRF